MGTQSISLEEAHLVARAMGCYLSFAGHVHDPSHHVFISCGTREHLDAIPLGELPRLLALGEIAVSDPWFPNCWQGWTINTAWCIQYLAARLEVGV